MTRQLFFVLAALLFTPVVAFGIEPSDIEPLLKRPLLDRAVVLREVRQYCDARVPKMPEIKSAEQWQAEAERLRAEVLERIVYRGEAARWRDAPAKVEWLGEIPGGPGYKIKKLRYEALPGMWIPALLYEPENLSGKVPAVMNVNGHSPEGKAYEPKQIRCINLAKKGILALNLEWVGMGQLGTENFLHYRMNQIDLCGSSGLAPFYLCMKRGLDLLLALEHTDPERVAVTGLSGGGWQTIVISSLDTRVKLSSPVAGYSSLSTRAWQPKDLGDSEQTPSDLGTICDYTHLTAMVAPRPLLLQFNSKDNCCFESGYVLPLLLDAALPVYRVLGKDYAIRWHVNDDPGTHNYERENREAFYRMVRDFFLPNSKFDATEIPSESELKSKEQLAVELPASNEDFHTLAMRLMENLPRDAAVPTGAAELASWQTARREQLRKLARVSDYAVAAEEVGAEQKPGMKATFWKLKLAADWTVPAVEIAPDGATKTAILVADEGRAAVATRAAALVASGHRVLAVDPFYLGESKPDERPELLTILVAGVGQRPLGLQAGQLMAASRWLAGRYGEQPVTIVAVGPRSSVSALVATALEVQAIGGLELDGALDSLKDVIRRNAPIVDMPELFCFGLLEAFDVEQLSALVAPRPVVRTDKGATRP
ncbi:MAG: acetylxylan esterase [Planctomycetia bacterium]|nr:acetylxylan esterase [Planctomycetia bacterium]